MICVHSCKLWTARLMIRTNELHRNIAIVRMVVFYYFFGLGKIGPDQSIFKFQLTPAMNHREGIGAPRIF